MRILFVGGGHMASALIGGMVKQGVRASEMRVVEISGPARARLQEQYGVRLTDSIGDAEIDEDVVLIAVKPQQAQLVAADLRSKLQGQLVISIAAGIRTRDFSSWLGGHERIVRVMPNTPALVGSGISALFAGKQIGRADREVARQILAAVGKVLWLENEDQMDIVTAVSGSGPAYVFYFMEALQQAAESSGLNAEQARELVIETFLGAAKLAASGDEPTALLRQRVTSKGGTTEQALKVLEAHGTKQNIVDAVRAAEQKSRELGDELGSS
ncbi:MAG: pyrroline-5-carboxylate reductase [Burkholderiales bacterium]